MGDERHTFRIKHFLPHWLLINFSSKHDRMESMLFALWFPISIASLGQEKPYNWGQEHPKSTCLSPRFAPMLLTLDQFRQCIWLEAVLTPKWILPLKLNCQQTSVREKKHEREKCIKISHANNISSLFLGVTNIKIKKDEFFWYVFWQEFLKNFEILV